MLPTNIVKEDKISKANIFRSTFSKYKPRSLLEQYNRIVLNKSQKTLPYNKATHLTLSLFSRP